MADFAEKNAKQLIALMGAMAMNGTGRPLGADRRRGLDSTTPFLGGEIGLSSGPLWRGPLPALHH